MRISHFSTFPYGGAATAALRLNKQLRKQRVDSRLFYNRSEQEIVSTDAVQLAETSEPPTGPLTSIVTKRARKKRRNEVYRFFNEHLAIRPENAETFSMARLPNQTQLDWNQVQADVINVHWISYFADYPSFFQSIPASVPIVWTLHDMNAFTGGCHYAGDCDRFATGCGLCPQINNGHLRDVSMDSFRVKQKTLANRNIHVVAPSQWMLDQAQQSPIWPGQTSFHKIHYGFDLKKLHPVDRTTARRQLGIKSDAIIIGFGADDVSNYRKGMHHMIGALEQMVTDEPVECLTFGAGEAPEIANVAKVHHQGFVDATERLRLIYSAADLVVVPSREDNQPQIGLEAMACGTPVVAFNAGGIPEYVKHGATGLLATRGDETELARQISWLISDPEARDTMGQRARLMMEREFENVQQTSRYVQLYENAAFFSRKLRVA